MHKYAKMSVNSYFQHKPEEVKNKLLHVMPETKNFTIDCNLYTEEHAVFSLQ